MDTRVCRWNAGADEHELRLVFVPGTAGRPYPFGSGAQARLIEVDDFHIAATPVTQALWSHVMGNNPSGRDEPRHPVTNVSWEQIAGAGGFLERINESEILSALAGGNAALRFRLPSEREWEYAARGGAHWTDGFRFSGSDNADDVAWYGHHFSKARRLLCRVLGARVGWRIAGRFPPGRPTRTREVAAKAPNQLGLYDMSGNVWEWCDDVCVDEIEAVASNGSRSLPAGRERRLRGGSHQNWDIHCTVWYRYGIAQDFRDGCIGFRLVLAPAREDVGTEWRDR